MIKELKEFLLGGGAFDLAIALVLAGAFGKVIESLVADVITPLIGAIAGGEAGVEWLVGPINMGNLITAILNFLIVGTVLFFIVKGAKKAMAMPGAPTPPNVSLLGEIRDILAGASKR